MAAKSGTRSSGDGAKEAADRIRELNERIVENARRAGSVYLEAYEQTLNAIAGYQETIAEATPVEWAQRMIEAQANFTREIGNVYASMARETSKK